MQEMNNANLPEANEDNVDSTILDKDKESVENENETNETSTDVVVKSEDPKETDKADQIDTELENETDEESHENHDEELDENFDNLHLDELIKILDKKVSTNKIQHLKSAVDALSKNIEKHITNVLEERKNEFISSGGAPEDFHVRLPQKETYDQIIRRYKSEKAKYYQDLNKSFKRNLATRKDLIEELKGLIGIDQPISKTYKQFKDLQKRWRETGHVPRAEANNIWKTYHHHVGIFYDFLHLNREFRELDYKYNYDEKIKIIEKAEALGKMDNVQKAFRNLQELHKHWKDELGPIAKEHGETLWVRFSEATKVIHEKRQFFQKNQMAFFEANYDKKKIIIAQMHDLCEIEVRTHNEIQKQIRDMEGLRTSFFECGHVINSKNAEIWSAFKGVMRLFSRKRNAFYKTLKKEYSKNLQKRMDLIEQAEAYLETEDFANTTPKVIALQKQWKKIGPISRKQNEKVWKLFQKACNNYFNRLDSKNNQASAKEQETFDAKNKLLAQIKKTKEFDRSTIDQWIESWIGLGSVEQKKNKINVAFLTAIETSLQKIGIDNETVASERYGLKLKLMSSETDLIHKERSILQKRLEKAKQEYIQLQTNMEFFSRSSSENPLVNKVAKDIEKQKRIIDELEKKKAFFRNL